MKKIGMKKLLSSLLIIILSIGYVTTDVSWSAERLIIDNSFFSITVVQGTPGTSTNADTTYVSGPAAASVDEGTQGAGYQAEIGGREYTVTICSGDCGRTPTVDDEAMGGNAEGLILGLVDGSAGAFPGSLAVNATEEEKTRYEQEKAAYEREKASLESQLSNRNATLFGLQTQVSAAQSNLNSAIGEHNQAASRWNAAKNSAQNWEQKKSDSAVELGKNQKLTNALRVDKGTKAKELQQKITERGNKVDKCDGQNALISRMPATQAGYSSEAAAATNTMVQASNTEAANTVTASNIEVLNEQIERFKVEEKATGPISFPGANGTDLGDQFQTNPLSVNGMAVRQLSNQLESSRQEISQYHGEGRNAANKMLENSGKTLQFADAKFAAGDSELGQAALRIAKNLLDVGVAVAPLVVLAVAPEAVILAVGFEAVSIAKSWYEYETGKSLWDGKALLPFQKDMALLNVAFGFVPAATQLGSATLGVFKGAIAYAKELLSAGKPVSIVTEIANSAKLAEKLLDSASEFGVKTAAEATDFLQTAEAVLGKEAVTASKLENLVEIATTLAKELNFTATTAKRMEDSARYVPREILAEAIKFGKKIPDPQGAVGAEKYIIDMFKNGKKYELEVVYREMDKTILHFLYK